MKKYYKGDKEEDSMSGFDSLITSSSLSNKFFLEWSCPSISVEYGWQISSREGFKAISSLIISIDVFF